MSGVGGWIIIGEFLFALPTVFECKFRGKMSLILCGSIYPQQWKNKIVTFPDWQQNKNKNRLGHQILSTIYNRKWILSRNFWKKKKYSILVALLLVTFTLPVYLSATRPLDPSFCWGCDPGRRHHFWHKTPFSYPRKCEFFGICNRQKRDILTRFANAAGLLCDLLGVILHQKWI